VTTAEMTVHDVQRVRQLWSLMGGMPHQFIRKKIPWNTRYWKIQTQFCGFRAYNSRWFL